MSVVEAKPTALEAALKDTVAAPPLAEPLPAWTDARKALITSWVEKYVDVLLIGSYEVNLVFHDKQPDGDERCAADTEGNYPYRSANTINFYPRWLKWNDLQQEYRVIHELFHIVNDPLYRALWRVVVKEQMVTWREAGEHNEALADHLASIVWALVRK